PSPALTAPPFPRAGERWVLYNSRRSQTLFPTPGRGAELPSRVVALGGSVTIRCEGRYRSMKFFLRKAGHPNPPVQTVPDGTVAEFPIPSVGREDGGSYTCEYHPIAEQNRSSHPSDPVEIIVGEPSYPKPNISLSPSGEVSLGGAVAVWCHGQHRGVRFVLNKERRHFTHVDPVGSEASFSIRNVSREDGGSYSCSYHSRSEPVAVSYPSDPVELGSHPKPSISVSPTGVIPMGGNVTIRCRHQRLDMRILFYKDGDGNYLTHTDPAGSEAEFPIPSARREHGGSYTCRYSNRTGPAAHSEPSDPVQIIVAGEGPSPASPLPAPPAGVIPVGGNVTIRCRHQHLGMRILLYKDGDWNYLTYTDPAGSEAEFPIPGARREQSGNYTCRYSTRTDPTAYSEPSDPVQIIVAGEGPSPNLCPGAPGSARGWGRPGRPGLGGCLGLALTVCLLCADPSLPRPSISLSVLGHPAPATKISLPAPRMTLRIDAELWDGGGAIAELLFQPLPPPQQTLVLFPLEEST
uniref:Ig-like domain-containing protein n=1 Tax=Chelydra serpentina TaxID=8475 RepID=A0A8C3RU28_CHESE